MREVLKWNKDYITGEEVKVKCFKPNEGLIGKAKIELYRDGEIVNETYTENIISNWVTDGLLYGVQYKILQDHTWSNTHTLKGNRFGTMMLSEYDGEESNDVWLQPLVNIVGYCPRLDQNAGSDVKRGVYNPTESYVEHKDGYYHAHLVYDFGTSQGNGTFKSIIWHSGNMKPRDYMFGTVTTRGVGMYSGDKWEPSMYTDYAGDLYVYNSSSKVYTKVVNQDLYMNGMEKIKTRALEGDEQYIQADRVIEGNKFIGISYTDSTHNNPAIAKLQVKNLSDYSVEKTIEIKTTDYFQEYYDKMYPYKDNRSRLRVLGIYKNGDVVIQSFIQVYSGNMLPTFDSEGNKIGDNSYSFTVHGVYNVITESWVMPFDVNNPKCIVNSKIYDFVAKRCFRFDDNTLVVQHYTITSQGNFAFINVESFEKDKKRFYDMATFGLALADSPEVRGFLPKSKAFAVYAYYKESKYEFKTITPYTAHTKLPNPVTKTSADTMKIQYDYYIQTPYIFPVNGSYLPPVVEPTS